MLSIIEAMRYVPSPNICLGHEPSYLGPDSSAVKMAEVEPHDESSQPQQGPTPSYLAISTSGSVCLMQMGKLADTAPETMSFTGHAENSTNAC